MSAWKQFTTKDVTITPFLADKGFSFTGGAITGSTVGINIYRGANFSPTSSFNAQTGFEYSSSVVNVYRSVKQLYYSNYISSSAGDTAVTSSVVPGVTSEFDRFVGPIEAPLYDNYLQSTLQQQRYIPTHSGANITVISIPQKIFGDKIVPYTFELEYSQSAFTPSQFLITDDGNGNIISGSDDTVVGQIFYSHGIVTLMSSSLIGLAKSVSQGSNIDELRISYSSSMKIYEQQFKCTILENEFGVSTNPSLLTSSADGEINTEYYPFATGSYFTPYVTCVGLYNEAKQLVAVGKLSFPLPISQFTDTSILVNFDI